MVLFVVLTTRWAGRHALPTTWDEAHYLTYINHDYFRWSKHGVRGFLAAYDVTTGKEVWHFNTVPGP